MKIKLNKSEATIYRHLKTLIDDGIIKRSGSRKTGHWKLLIKVNNFL